LFLFLPITTQAYDRFNCWSYITERVDKIIPVVELINNATTTPHLGDIAVMRYEKQGLNHFAYVELVTDDFILVSETNYKAGIFGFRFLPLDYPNLIGYYNN